MLRSTIIVLIIAICPFSLYSQMPLEAVETTGSKQIDNLISAVKEANPGDYILLPSGNKYILTREEIAIARGEFNYEDLSSVRMEKREDGTEVRTISESHIAYLYPDGQSTHILKTSISFTAFMRHIEETYYLARYIDYYENAHDFTVLDPPIFNVFRASVQFQTLSDGIDEIQSIIITVYNYDEQNKRMRYCSKPEMIWGYISERGSYVPVNESHEIEFDIE
jgi:hypothetical protein